MAECSHIHITMFADDLTIWKTGNNVDCLASNISQFVTKSLIPWLTSHNMKLSLRSSSTKKTKCYSFLFTTHWHDPWPCIRVCGQVLPCPMFKNRAYKQPRIRILGVFLDPKLTMKHHLEHILSKANERLALLARFANSQYGMSQCSLRTMYITYI